MFFCSDAHKKIFNYVLTYTYLKVNFRSNLVDGIAKPLLYRVIQKIYESLINNCSLIQNFVKCYRNFIKMVLISQNKHNMFPLFIFSKPNSLVGITIMLYT